MSLTGILRIISRIDKRDKVWKYFGKVNTKLSEDIEIFHPALISTARVLLPITSTPNRAMLSREKSWLSYLSKKFLFAYSIRKQETKGSEDFRVNWGAK